MMCVRAVFLIAAAVALRPGTDPKEESPLAPKLHFLTMGHTGSCFWGKLFGTDAGRPYIFEPFNAGMHMWRTLVPSRNVRDGYKVGTSSVEHSKLERRLQCIYTCQCEGLLSAEGSRIMKPVCERPATTDMTIVKTVAMNNATSLITMLPHHSLQGSKFVLMLRDPRNTRRDNACQRMLSLALSIKKLAAVVGTENVRTIFAEEWALDVPKAVSDVASWAGISESEAMPAMLHSAHAGQRASPAAEVRKWISKGDSAISLGEKAWCKEFFELVGYPAYSPSATGSYPSFVDYSHLSDPSQTPMTDEQEQILERLWSDVSSFSFAQEM